MAEAGQPIEELFGEALALPPESRAAFLDQACRNDPDVRRLIEQLLLQHERAGSFLASPAFGPRTATAQLTASPAAADGRFQPEQLIANRFAIVRFIARGGMGEVYEARDQFLHDTRVALKIIRPEIAADAASSSRFEQEVILARKVNHPNLCPIYEIFRCQQPEPAFLFLTMKLLEGDTLDARLRQSSKLEPGEAATICTQLLAGVAALHDAGIIHRDLKPNNVMLASEEGRTHVSIMDFGLARLHQAENTMASGMIAGTPGYLAPELLRGERPTKASDLFALGIVLHQVLTGERPTASRSGLAISPALRTVKAPATLVQAVESFLSPDPEIRCRAFSQARAGQDGAAAPQASLRPDWLRGKRLWFLLAAATAIVLVGVAILLTPAPVTGPLDSSQVTASAEPKTGPIFTDGSRLYFNSRGEPSAMALGGGPIVPTRILEQGMQIADISADGSKILAVKPDTNDEVGRGTLWIAPMLGGTPRKLNDHLVRSARWFPDGRSILYSDQNALYRVDADGQNLRKIWTATADLDDLGVSPDGRQLSVTVGEDFESHRLWTVTADGQNAHPLLREWPGSSNQYSGQWTPDGRHFLFASDREGRGNLYELVAPRWFEFWKKPAAVRITGNQVSISDSTPARDGAGVFALGRMDEGATRAYDPVSKKLAPFLDDLSMLAFVISPDRQWMAYSEYPSRHLWKSRLDGSDKVQLTDTYAEMQQWSPDGKWLVYSDWQNLYLVSADGGVPEKLTPDGPRDIAPTWSPDGKSIAFSYFPYPGRALSIRILDLASRRISEMPNSAGYLWPSWSPDGRYLVAIAKNPVRMMLYSAETRTWKALHQFDVVWSYWVWAADSKSLYVSLVQGENGIYHLTVPGGEWTKLSGLEGVNDANGFDSFLSLTPSGQPAIMSRTGVAQIYLLRWPDRGSPP